MNATANRRGLGLTAGALALAAGACSQPAGLRVDVDLGAFKTAALSLEVAISASPGGFVSQTPENPGGATVTTEDVDGDGVLDLVARFPGPFPGGTVSFRVTTDNHEDLTMHAQALAFDTNAVIAGQTGDTTLPATGRASLALALAAQASGSVGPDTRSTDLQTASADVAIKGPNAMAQASAIAACDVNGDGQQDLVIGVPGASPDLNLGPTGAAYVVFGGAAAPAAITLAPGDSSQFHFYGQNGGDRLGAAVACADLNNDGIDDLVVGAPGVGNGKGSVYVVLGRTALRTTSVDFTNHPPDGQWTTNVAGAGLGAVLYAADLDGNGKAEILASAPGAQKVHLLSGFSASVTPVDADVADHPTFSGVHATAIGAGDLDGSGGPLDVILGDAEYRATGETTKRGVVYVFAAVSPTTSTSFSAGATDETGPRLTMVGNTDMQFGAAVLALDTSGYGQDLLVGAPNDGGDGSGAVYLYEHDGSFFDAPMRLYTDVKQKLAVSVPGAHFGSALAGSRTGAATAGSYRLVVGAPDTIRGSARSGAGAAYLFGGGAERRFPLLEQLYGAALGDHLGAAVAGGQINADDAIGDLIAAAPYATGAGAQAGVVYVRLGRR